MILAKIKQQGKRALVHQWENGAGLPGSLRGEWFVPVCRPYGWYGYRPEALVQTEEGKRCEKCEREAG